MQSKWVLPNLFVFIIVLFVIGINIYNQQLYVTEFDFSNNL